MHDYHDGLPGFSNNQILHDGCAECEARSKGTAGGLAYLDKTNVARAWARAAEWNREGLTDMARCESALLSALWIVQVQLEHYDFPIGTIPVRIS